MDGRGEGGRAIEHASAMPGKKTTPILARNIFNPVSLAKIASEEKEAKRKAAEEMQEKLGPEFTDTIENISEMVKQAKREAEITRDTSKLEYYGEVTFKMGRLNDAVDIYLHAAEWGSKTAAGKLSEVAEYIFTKEHSCDDKHSTSGCQLRSKAIKALAMVGSEEDLLKIGKITQDRNMHHCAISSCIHACMKGSKEAKRRLVELSGIVESKDPYLAKVALAYSKK